MSKIFSFTGIGPVNPITREPPAQRVVRRRVRLTYAALCVALLGAPPAQAQIRLVQGGGLAPRIVAAALAPDATGTGLAVDLGPFKHLPTGPRVLLRVSIVAPDGTPKLETTRQIATLAAARASAARQRVALSVPGVMAPDDIVTIGVTATMPGSAHYALPQRDRTDAR